MLLTKPLCANSTSAQFFASMNVILFVFLTIFSFRATEWMPATGTQLFLLLFFIFFVFVTICFLRATDWMAATGTHFTCFTSSQVQIPMHQRDVSLLPSGIVAVFMAFSSC